MKKRPKYNWISLHEILAVHEKLLALHGGGVGLRDMSLLESALSRAHTYINYEEKVDIFDLASFYADGIVNNHPFVDGNKRTGFIAAALFIETNGFSFQAKEEEVVSMTLGLAGKTLSREEYAQWLREASS